MRIIRDPGCLSPMAREIGMSVAAWSGSLLSRERAFSALQTWLAPAFGCAELRRSAAAFLDGVLVVDETGFKKKAMHSVGVARRHFGMAGRVETCRVAVFLDHASRPGKALIERRLYLPEMWASDATRRRCVQVPRTVEFATRLRAIAQPALVLAWSAWRRRHRQHAALTHDRSRHQARLKY